MASVYDYSAMSLKGETVALDSFRDKVLVIVNTASKCGFTPQYQGLEDLHRTYSERGFAVLGFPCNQFGGQEPGNSDDIGQFCSSIYGVTFPMFARIDVNGADAHPLFDYLKRHKPGFLGSQNIKWNFTKFLIARDGTPVTRYAPTATPKSMHRDIEKVLG